MVRQIETRLQKLEAVAQAVAADDPDGVDAKFGLSKMNDTELKNFGHELNLNILSREDCAHMHDDARRKLEAMEDEVRKHVLENREPDMAARIAKNLEYYGGVRPEWWQPHWEWLAEAWGIAT